MADFSTHLFGATVVCTFAATLATKVLGLPMADGLLLAGAGIVGGVLPDIDLGKSVPSRLLFGTLGIAAAMLWLFANVERYSVVELWCIGLAIAIAVRFPAAAVFDRCTVHRGALHSIAAALMFGVLTSIAAAAALGMNAANAWLLGGFMSAGYVVHLTLDEIYSVDFSGARIRRSFGSALKPIDLDHVPASIAVVAVTTLAWWWTPPTAPALDALRRIATGWPDVMLP